MFDSYYALGYDDGRTGSRTRKFRLRRNRQNYLRGIRDAIFDMAHE